MKLKNIIETLKLIRSNNSEVLQMAQGKYEYTGKIIRDVKQIIRNGK